jgi:hypothetical protein
MLNQPPTTPEPEEESLASLRDSLREAQRRLAYYERFGPLLEEQMSTVVAKAAEVTRESEQDKAEIEREVARLRQEAEALRAECEWQRAEASAIIAQAHHDAASILARARAEVSNVVNSALTQLEQAQKEVLQTSGPVATHAAESRPTTAGEPPEPPSATHTPWTPVIEGAEAHAEVADPGAPEGELSREDDQEASADRVIHTTTPEPSAMASPAEGAPDDAVVTYLTVHSHLTQETLPQFGRSLEELPGVRGTAVARVSDDSVELVVAHHRETDLLARMRSIPGLEFRLVARGEGQVEIEILERNAPPLRA